MAATAHTTKINRRHGGGYFVTCSCGLHDFAEHRSTANIIKIEHAKETKPDPDPYNLRASLDDPFVGLS